MDFTFIYHIYRHCDFMFELEHLALKLGMNFFSLPFDAVNIYSVTMISEYVCSCDNIILKKRKTCKAWQWSREMTKNNMKYELKQKKSYWKLIQTQQEFLVKCFSLPSDISLINAVGWVVHMSCYFYIAAYDWLRDWFLVALMQRLKFTTVGKCNRHSLFRWNNTNKSVN